MREEREGDSHKTARLRTARTLDSFAFFAAWLARRLRRLHCWPIALFGFNANGAEAAARGAFRGRCGPGVNRERALEFHAETRITRRLIRIT